MKIRLWKLQAKFMRLENDYSNDDEFRAKIKGWIAHANHGNTYNLRKDIIKHINLRFR